MVSLSSIKRCEILLLTCLISTFTITIRAGAQTFTTPDQAFSFTYPQRWEAADPNGVVKITAPDGSAYTLKLDAINTAVTASSPMNDAGLKQAAAKIAALIAPGATFVRASSISMDHGLGASFRFTSSAGANVDIWIGLIGKHSVVLAPVKAGQPGQTIGLSVIFQSMAFTDTLPKQPVRQAPKPEMTDNGQNTAATSTHTVFYSKQIAPILMQRCVACHSSQSASGGLNTSSYSAFIAGGTRGSVVKPGNVAGSSLIDYLTGARDQMPKGSAPLSADQIDLFRTWIREGATNDLDPSSSRGAVSSPSFSPGAATTRHARANNSAAPGSTIGRAAGSSANGMAKAFEGYTGHLASNDTSFEMHFYTNGTVSANWSFDQPSPARYQGTYTLTAGIYTIKMNQVSGSIPGGSKTLKLVMEVSGTDVIGRFSLDTTAPMYKIMSMELSEIDNATKNANANAPVGNAPTRRKKNQRPRNHAPKPRQQQWIRVP